VVSLFCYENRAFGALIAALAGPPTLLLLTPGAAQRQASSAGSLPANVRALPLPWLAQPDFDHLLWSSELNAVRGEDSFVRALWAGAPFLWQAYPQADGAHVAKVEAAIARLAWPPEVAAAWRGWNGMAAFAGLPAAAPWRRATEAARAALWAQDDLVTRLRRFVAPRLARRDPASPC
jgi:uncharacterized repeat protein (TIGR03837 family)